MRAREGHWKDAWTRRTEVTEERAVIRVSRAAIHGAQRRIRELIENVDDCRRETRSRLLDQRDGSLREGVERVEILRIIIMWVGL